MISTDVEDGIWERKQCNWLLPAVGHFSANSRASLLIFRVDRQRPNHRNYYDFHINPIGTDDLQALLTRKGFRMFHTASNRRSAHPFGTLSCSFCRRLGVESISALLWRKIELEDKKYNFAQENVMKTLVRYLMLPLRRRPEFFLAIREIFHPRRAIYQHFHFRGPFTLQVSDQASFVINHFGYQVENDLFWAGFGRGWEGMELRLWRALTQDAEFIADVGANTGVFSLAAAALNPLARIVALEPVQRIYEKLVANIALNSFKIRALQIAASDFDGEAIMFDTGCEHIYSASLDGTMLDGPDLLRVPVRAARLDSLFDEVGWPRVDLLKIDVEKHEPAVLAGMRKRLAQDRPTILIEILNHGIGEAVARLVQRLDYRFFAIDERAGLIGTEKLDHGETRNYLLCRSELWECMGPRIKEALI